MHEVDRRDRVVALDDLPGHSAGAPLPLLLADDNRLLLSYLTAPQGHEIAIVEFAVPRAHYFGSPNDEALAGHALYGRGLLHYGIFEVHDSSWIRALERMNRVHPRHDPRRFDRLRHFIFTFHDCTFECVAESVSIAARIPNSAENAHDLLSRMGALLRRRSAR
jgi:hypothetical protein